MLPYMDMWSYSAVYLALALVKMQNENVFDDWLEDWYIYINKISQNFKLKTEIKECYFI